MSFNIRHGAAEDGGNSWPFRRMMVQRVIGDFAPDVLGTQEALTFQLDEIQDGLSGYSFVGVGRRDGVEAGEYAAILYRSNRLDLLDQGTFWFSDTPQVPGSKSWGNSVTRICTWARFEEAASGTAFYVYNLHLDHQSQPSRERSVELLTERIARREHPDPVVVTGDFNAGEENPAMRYLLGATKRASEGTDPVSASPLLVDTYRSLHPDATNVGTFNDFSGVSDGEKIDAVLVSEEWTVLEAAIVRMSQNGRYPSDHFPVTAVLELGR
jgi:endonuclease/exonuclease/phosphatase family metal-dependent hydrolase